MTDTQQSMISNCAHCDSILKWNNERLAFVCLCKQNQPFRIESGIERVNVKPLDIGTDLDGSIIYFEQANDEGEQSDIIMISKSKINELIAKLKEIQ